MASINAESARYKELKEDKYYLPEDFAIKLKNMEGNYFIADYFSDQEINPTWEEMLSAYTELGNKLYHQCLEELTPILGRKRAKESARYFKTYNSQIQADVMFNMRSFANFLKLRNSEHAQVEIREIAQQMLDLVKSIEGNPFEQTIKSITNGK
jgi:thymidylate synthase ThyX